MLKRDKQRQGHTQLVVVIRDESLGTPETEIPTSVEGIWNLDGARGWSNRVRWLARGNPDAKLLVNI